MILQTVHACWYWLAQNPLGTGAILYAMGVIAVLVHAYFEPREQT